MVGASGSRSDRNEWASPCRSLSYADLSVPTRMSRPGIISELPTIIAIHLAASPFDPAAPFAMTFLEAQL
jgi:hypothetical protein